MTDTAISPLRRRMIEDMTIRQFRPTTQDNYIRFVKQFSIFSGQGGLRGMSGGTSFT
jgi:integrase/recombinase XerD